MMTIEVVDELTLLDVELVHFTQVWRNNLPHIHIHTFMQEVSAHS